MADLFKVFASLELKDKMSATLKKAEKSITKTDKQTNRLSKSTKRLEKINKQNTREVFKATKAETRLQRVRRRLAGTGGAIRRGGQAVGRGATSIARGGTGGLGGIASSIPIVGAAFAATLGLASSHANKFASSLDTSSEALLRQGNFLNAFGKDVKTVKKNLKGFGKFSDISTERAATLAADLGFKEEFKEFSGTLSKLVSSQGFADPAEALQKIISGGLKAGGDISNTDIDIIRELRGGLGQGIDSDKIIIRQIFEILKRSNLTRGAGERFIAEGQKRTAQQDKLIKQEERHAIIRGREAGVLERTMALRERNEKIMRGLGSAALEADKSLTDMTNTAVKFVSKFLGLNIEGKASGGSVQANKPYMVGEKGAELFKPRSSGTIVPNHKLKAGGGGSVNQNISINITNQSPTSTAKMVIKELEKYARIGLREQVGLDPLAG